jgi:hypothetical protein
VLDYSLDGIYVLGDALYVLGFGKTNPLKMLGRAAITRLSAIEG